MYYTQENVLAGIVTYNPDIERLKLNIKELSLQVKSLYVVDNGSKNIAQVEELLAEFDCIEVKLKRFSDNLGIAAGLWDIMDYASKNHFQWVLSLDQDSVIETGLIEKYLEASNEARNQNVGMFTCLIKDRNFKDDKYEDQAEDELDVPYCITSAAFTNVNKYQQTEGYDINFFIDAVDFDICYSLREKGYRVCRINYVGLCHEVGHGENRKFLWKTIVVYHQNPMRIFYYSRNLKYMYRKHKKLYPFLLFIKTELTLFIRILLYEDSRIKKLKNFLKGIMM